MFVIPRRFSFTLVPSRGGDRHAYLEPLRTNSGFAFIVNRPVAYPCSRDNYHLNRKDVNEASLQCSHAPRQFIISTDLTLPVEMEHHQRSDANAHDETLGTPLSDVIPIGEFGGTKPIMD